MASDSTIITSICWVSRGFAKQVLDDYEPKAEELRAYQELTKKLEKK